MFTSRKEKMMTEQNRLYAERERINNRLKEVENVKGNLNRILGKEKKRSQKPQAI